MCFRRDLAQLEALSVSNAGDQPPLRLLAERVEFLSLVSNPLSTSHGPGASRTVGSVFFTISLRLESFFSELLSEVYLEFCDQHYRDEFPRTSSDEFPRTSRFVRFDGRRMFSLRDGKDPDVHDANSAWVRLSVTLEIGKLCSMTLLQSSCAPLSQYTSQVKCWKERLHGIVFDRTAILFSERASDCNNLLYFGELSNYFCTLQVSVYPDRIELLPDFDWRTSGSLLWKTRTASPFWDFVLPESIHTGWCSTCRERSRCGRCIRRSHPITVHCLAMQDQPENLLNVRGLLRNTRHVRKNEGSSSTEIFSVSSSFARKPFQAWIDQCEVAANLDLNKSVRSSNLTAPSSSRWTESSCRSYLIMNCDTSKQPWLNFLCSISIHFRSLYGIDTGDNVKVGVGRGLAFATSFPVLLSPTLSTGISSDVSVTYLLIPFTTRTQKQFCHERRIRSWLHTVTSLLITDLHIQDWTDLRFSTDPPSHVGWFLTSRWTIHSTWSFQIIKCIIIECGEELSFLNILRETSIGAEFGQFLLFRKFCEFLFVFTQQVSLYFGISLRNRVSSVRGGFPRTLRVSC